MTDFRCMRGIGLVTLVAAAAGIGLSPISLQAADFTPPCVEIRSDSVLVRFDPRDVVSMTLRSVSAGTVYCSLDRWDGQSIARSIQFSEPDQVSDSLPTVLLTLEMHLKDGRSCCFGLHVSTFLPTDSAGAATSGLGFRSTRLLELLARMPGSPPCMREALSHSQARDVAGVRAYWEDAARSPAGRRSLDAILDSLAVYSDLQFWMNAWRQAIPGFDVDSLVFTGWSRLNEYRFPFSAGSPGFAVHDSSSFGAPVVLFESPYGRRAVDVWNVAFTQEEGVWIPCWEPDTFVSVLDFSMRVWTRIVDCGTGGGFDVAAWVDSTSFVIAGECDAYLCPPREKDWRPMLMVIDLERHARISAVGPTVPGSWFRERVRPQMLTWRREKFPEIAW